MDGDHLEVDQYGPINILAHEILASDHIHQTEDVMWHGMIIMNKQPHDSVSGNNNQDLIRGASLNQLLIIYFNICLEDSKRLKDDLEFPGDKKYWLDIADDIFISFSNICSVNCILNRVIHLFELLLTGSRKDNLLFNTLCGSVEFIIKWINQYHSFMEANHILHVLEYTYRINNIIRQHFELSSLDHSLIQLVNQIHQRILVIIDDCKSIHKIYVKKPTISIQLPENNSINLMAEKLEKERLEKEENEAFLKNKTDKTERPKVPEPKLEVFGLKFNSDSDSDSDSFSKSSVGDKEERLFYYSDNNNNNKIKIMIKIIASSPSEPDEVANKINYFISIIPEDFDFLGNPKELYNNFHSLNVFFDSNNIY